jgi:magnesium chelatase subunit D
LVGQKQLKLALLLSAVCPEIGGVLLRGEKGAGKSTAVRALAAVLPVITCFAGCEYACDPARPGLWCPRCRENACELEVVSRPVRMVTLPLGATPDMVCGSLDLAQALNFGRLVPLPGLLAKANRGILYVDEVNLLGDHLVDVVLDSAASGENLLEREGLSFRHQASFCLVGTMNPEEGALRPQLLDRFGLCVDVAAESDPATRVEIMERRERFEKSPEAFAEQFRAAQIELSGRLERAGRLVRQVRLGPGAQDFIVELAAESRAAGHRAELTLARAALAHCALDGRTLAGNRDVLAVAEMVLAHRRREAVPPERGERNHDRMENEDPGRDSKDEDRGDGESNRPEDQQGQAPQPRGPRNQEPGDQPSRDDGKADIPSGRESAENPDEDRVQEAGAVFNVKHLSPDKDRVVRKGSGRRLNTRTEEVHGRVVGFRAGANCQDLNLGATLRAAAIRRKRPGGDGGLAVDVRSQDWRRNIRRKRVGGLIVFLVDASGSMGARGRMAASKGAVLSLLLDAYRKRDRVAMLTFRRDKASLALPPTSSVETASRLLAELPVGGRTPLGSALLSAFELLQNELRREPSLRPLAVLITDGKATRAIKPGSDPMAEALGMAGRLGQDRRIRWIVIDTEEPGAVRFRMAEPLAVALGGQSFSLDELRADNIVNILKGL